MAGLICLSLVRWGAMHEWKEVPAVILGVALETHDDTLKVTAIFQYRYAGLTYRGSQVGLHSGSDNIGDYHRRVFRELDHYRRNGRSFHAFVNPENPSEAVLYRDLRWEVIGFYAIFVVTFGGAGIGLMVLGFIGRNRQREAERLRELYPDAPWMHRLDWSRGTIRSTSKSTMVTSLVFAILWNAISSPLWFLLPQEVVEKKNRLALIGVVFPLVGIVLLVWAVRNVLRWRRYGRSVLILETIPGVVGGALQGTVHVGSRLEPEGPYRLTLNCIRRHTTGSGDDRSTTETILGQEERQVPAAAAGLGPSGPALPIVFAIPFDSYATDFSKPDDQVLWRLEVTAPARGIDFATSFEVPVFRTPQSSPDFRLPDQVRDASALPSLADRLARSGVLVEKLPDGEAYRFPMARHPGAALGLTLFWAIWSGFILLMHHLGAPLFFPLVFGVVDLLILAGVLDLWFGAGRLTVRSGTLECRHGLFGVGRQRRLEKEEILAFKSSRGMQAGRKLFYNLVAETGAGKKQVLGRRLDSRETAEDLARRIKELLGAGQVPEKGE